jgi:histidinol-phosphate phosphatase family protein
VSELLTVFANADLVVANDSGLMHLASAVGTPVVAVFGPTHPSLGFAPQGQFDRVADVDEYCRPCSLHGKKPCFRDKHHCFERISPDRVAAEASEMLAQITGEKGLLVDRDGTIMVNKHYPSRPDEVELIPGAAAALKQASDAGYRIIILSNQSGVARGYFGIEAVDQVNARLLELLLTEGARVDALYYCPYFEGGSDPEYGRESYNRKPGAGMAEAAAEDLGVDLRSSVVIGDSQDDYNLGRVVGARSILVRTGYGEKVEQRMRSSGSGSDLEVFDDLQQAVNHLLGEDTE